MAGQLIGLLRGFLKFFNGGTAVRPLTRVVAVELVMVVMAASVLALLQKSAKEVVRYVAGSGIVLVLLRVLRFIVELLVGVARAQEVAVEHLQRHWCGVDDCGRLLLDNFGRLHESFSLHVALDSNSSKVVVADCCPWLIEIDLFGKLKGEARDKMRLLIQNCLKNKLVSTMFLS